MPPPGFKRSRALWDEARRSRQTKSEQVNSWVRVALYEIQPIRFNQINTQGIQSIASWVVQSLWTCVVRTPSWVRGFSSFLKRRTVQQWMVVAGVFAYYWFVRWMHEVLDAGPVVIILTCLTLIFTIGLGDNQQEDGISAYSVFNRGFQRLLGSVDADALLAQHVGGGFGGFGGGGGHHNQFDDDNHHDRPIARRQRQQQQQQHRQREPNDDNIENDNDNRQEEEQQQQNNGGGGARRSGKKKRRQDLERRQEIRRQRDLARQLGMNGDDNMAPQEMVAMQRMIEEQVAADQNRNNNHGEGE